MFLFENLEAYKKAMELTEIVMEISKGIKERAIKDQLIRAVLSIPLNIAEGQGRFHTLERKQFFNTARGSLFECVPIIEICNKIGFIKEEEHKKIRGFLEEISRMLAGLIKYENSKRGVGY